LTKPDLLPQDFQKAGNPLAREGRDGNRVATGLLDEPFAIGRGGGKVHLVSHDEKIPFGQIGLIERQFPSQRLEILDGISAFGSGHIEDVDEKAGAFNVAQKIESQAGTLVRSGNETRNVGHPHGCEIVETDGADYRVEGGEGVSGDLRMGMADGSKEGGFPGVGKTDQSRVGHQF